MHAYDKIEWILINYSLSGLLAPICVYTGLEAFAENLVTHGIMVLSSPLVLMSVDMVMDHKPLGWSVV